MQQMGPDAIGVLEARLAEAEAEADIADIRLKITEAEMGLVSLDPTTASSAVAPSAPPAPTAPPVPVAPPVPAALSGPAVQPVSALSAFTIGPAPAAVPKSTVASETDLAQNAAKAAGPSTQDRPVRFATDSIDLSVSWRSYKQHIPDILKAISMGKKDPAAPIQNCAPYEIGFYNRAYPSPHPANKEAINDPMVYLVRGLGTPEVEYNLMPFSKLALWKGQGFRAIPTPKPVWGPSGKDDRRVALVSDVYTTDAPWKDTRKVFGPAIEITQHAGWLRLDWELGQFPSPDDEAKGGHSISTVPWDEYPGPGKWEDLRSLTTLTHYSNCSAPPDAGVGWGDFAYFENWVTAGRHPKDEMFDKQKEWSRDASDPLVFVSSETGEKTVITETIRDKEPDEPGIPPDYRVVTPMTLPEAMGWRRETRNTPQFIATRGRGRGGRGREGVGSQRGRGQRGRGWIPRMDRV